jgi:hypothetical protein
MTSGYCDDWEFTKAAILRLVEIGLKAIPGSCDAGWPALLPNLRGRVFADRERLYRIFALVEPCQSTIFRAGAVAADPKLTVQIAGWSRVLGGRSEWRRTPGL